MPARWWGRLWCHDRLTNEVEVTDATCYGRYVSRQRLSNRAREHRRPAPHATSVASATPSADGTAASTSTIATVKKAWGAACKAAGFPVGRKAGGFTFHHCRNSAATDLAAAGLTIEDAMAVGGWKTAALARAARERGAAPSRSWRRLTCVRPVLESTATVGFRPFLDWLRAAAKAMVPR